MWHFKKEVVDSGMLPSRAMGEVYVAEQANIKTRVAIKALLPHISANTEHVERFFNEAIAARRIRHAGIPKVFDVGFTASGRAYLVMEYLEGETLASRIRRAAVARSRTCSMRRTKRASPS